MGRSIPSTRRIAYVAALAGPTLDLCPDSRSLDAAVAC